MDYQQPPAGYVTTAPNALFAAISGPTYLVIPGQVRISMKDGSIEFDPNYSPTAAARKFWEAMSQDYRDMLRWKVEHGERR
jgi:hypothetical protein